MKQYVITLGRTDGRMRPVVRIVYRVNATEAIDAAQRELRRFRRTWPTWQWLPDRWSVAEPSTTVGFRIIATGGEDGAEPQTDQQVLNRPGQAGG